MNADAADDLIPHLSYPVDDPRYSDQIFNLVAKKRRAAQAHDGDNIKRVCSEEYEEISRKLDLTGVQESTAVRNILRTRRLANLLINDKGELNVSLIPHTIDCLTSVKHSCGPQRQFDSMRNAHIIHVLKALIENKDLTQKLKRINKPYANLYAEQIIRETLQAPPNMHVTDAHARRAALAAWMSYLRQNIGSCFATAPAIIVHSEQPELFLTDLAELLATGRLKRTYGGAEYSVPLSPTWGAGDLRKPIPLSKDESKDDSAVWNAPGLFLALEAAGVINKELSIKEKFAAIKDLIVQAFPEWNINQPYLFTTIDEILRRILMLHLKITPKDLEDYDNRPIGMIHTGLLLQTSAAKMGGVGEACASFYQLLERASNHFKALTDNALLKSWEYTLASFAEIKADFTRWNLYASLGLQPNEPGGIGACLQQILQLKLDASNQKVHDLQTEYEQVYAHIQALESRSRHLADERDAQWTRAEYQSRVNEFYTFEEIRNKAHGRAQLFANLYNILITAYDKLFPTYFQEVYDADLYDVKTGIFDDSPAGFRLLYKYGRGSTAQWTKIRKPQEFVDALGKFFTTTENEILAMDELKGIESDVSEIITAIVSHVHTHEFLETAFHRMAIAHNIRPIAHPLENLDKIPAKPWAYISGGTMNTLLNCYFRREQTLTEISRWVENPTELLVFFIDTIKRVPYASMEPFIKDPDKSMLMHSPTHAFLLKPGSSPLKDAWQNEAYTYTWLRDFLIRPMSQFVEQLDLDEMMMEFLVEKLVPAVPENFQHYFRKSFSNMHGRMHASHLRDYIVNALESERGLQYRGQPVLSPDTIDSTLYAHLPLFPGYQLAERLQKVFGSMKLTSSLQTRLKKILEEAPLHAATRFLGAQTLYETALSFLCMATEKTGFRNNIAQEVITACRKLGFMAPTPIIFADTNWPKELFAFLVSPGSNMLELWRVDPTGRTGTPMSIWKKYLNGSVKDLQWGVYPQTHEYTSFLT